tara:strand:+ start:2395 stop:2580 length:186 start_codon:yes stop_codon:yes gene_type:complete
MDQELRAYFLYMNGVRTVRYAAPEVLVPLFHAFQNLSKNQKEALRMMYEKNKSKVFKFLEV